MFARHGIRNALRTPKRSVAFLLLMTLLVTLLGTSLGLSFALQRTLRQCRENYSTIGLVEYLGPGYPSTTKVVADAGEVLAEFEEKLDREDPALVAWEPTRMALGYTPDLGMLTNEDVVLAISNGGESKELSDILIYCKRYGIPLISMTKNPDSTLGKAGDIVLRLPDAGEACPLGLAPTSSTTATLVLGDILAIALMERKGFSKSNYKQRHPGGKLGAILQKVSDLMHTGDEMPILDEHAALRQIILTMSSKMLGCVGIINENGDLSGMITDGDLRRAMASSLDNDLFGKTAEDIMTRNPKTTSPDTLVAEALNVMNTTGKGITQLFVVDGKKPIGVIHMHDCLRAGFTVEEKKTPANDSEHNKVA